MPYIAFLFPGPGSAEPGMGKDLYNKVPLLREAVDKADKALAERGVKVTRACFVSPAAEMRRPSIAGPASLAFSVGTALALKGRRVQANLLGALGWGEVAALAAFGAIDYDEALRFMHTRGLLLEEAWARAPFHVISVGGLPVEQLEAKLAALPQPPLRVALISPESCVLAGEEAVLKKLGQVLAGLGRQVKVSAVEPGWDWPHPSFAGVAPAMTEAFARLKIESIPQLIYGAGGDTPVRRPFDWQARLAALCTQSLDWPGAAAALRKAGMDTAVEMGAGQALGQAIHKIDTGVRVLATTNTADIALAAKLAV